MEVFNYDFAQIKKYKVFVQLDTGTSGSSKSSSDSPKQYYLPINTKFLHGHLTVSAQYTQKVHENRRPTQGHQPTHFNGLSFISLILGVVLSTTTHSFLNFSAI